jgi:adenosylcobinamide-GDP ribazoletransferase
VVAAGVLALGSGELVLRQAVRRLGGLTGDVLGAVTEVATAVAFVCLVARG